MNALRHGRFFEKDTFKFLNATGEHDPYHSPYHIWLKLLILAILLGLLVPVAASEIKGKFKHLELVEAPNLIGLTVEDAKERVAQAGLEYGRRTIIVENRKYQGQEGKVVKQKPAAGQSLPKGATVRATDYNPTKRGFFGLGGKKYTLRKLPDFQPDFRWSEDDHRAALVFIENQGEEWKAMARNEVEAELIIKDQEGSELYRWTKAYPGTISHGQTVFIKFNSAFGHIRKSHTVAVRLDPENKIDETNENNNTSSYRDLPDFMVKDLWIEKTGDRLKAYSKIRNVGTKKSTGNWTFSWFLDGDRYPYGPSVGVPLSATQEYTLSKEFLARHTDIDAESHQLAIELNDGNRSLEELSRDNNRLEKEVAPSN